MFFGAGNLIFPPYLGLETGTHWWIGFICYYLADIGLALMALFAMKKPQTPRTKGLRFLSGSAMCNAPSRNQNYLPQVDERRIRDVIGGGQRPTVVP